MAGRRAAFPVAPDLPELLEPAPGRLADGDAWDGVRADARTRVDERVADADLRECEWTDGQLVGVRFTGLRAQDVRFTGCDLSRAGVQGVTVDGVDLRGSALADLRGAVSLAGARIDADQVVPLGAALLGQLGFVVE